MQSANLTDEPRLAQKWLLRTLGGPKRARGWRKSGPFVAPLMGGVGGTPVGETTGSEVRCMCSAACQGAW